VSPWDPPHYRPEWAGLSPPAPAPPAEDPTMPKTIGEVNKKRMAAKEVVDANLKAAADLDAKIKADNDTFAATTVEFAADLKKFGDYFELNPDGTATAYFSSATTADGFYSEVLKPADTTVDEDAQPPPDDSPAEPHHVEPHPDEIPA
jgi:hypothetical protein